MPKYGLKLSAQLRVKNVHSFGMNDVNKEAVHVFS